MRPTLNRTNVKHVVCVSLVLAAVGPSLVNAQETTGLPRKISEHFDKLVGDWKVEGRFLRISFVGKRTVKWAEGQHCLIVTTTSSPKDSPEVVAHSTSIIGWDPVADEIVEQTCYDLGGGMAILRGKMKTTGRIEGGVVHVTSGRTNKAKYELVENSPGHWHYKGWTETFVPAEYDIKKVDE